MTEFGWFELDFGRFGPNVPNNLGPNMFRTFRTCWRTDGGNVGSWPKISMLRLKIGSGMLRLSSCMLRLNIGSGMLRLSLTSSVQGLSLIHISEPTRPY